MRTYRIAVPDSTGGSIQNNASSRPTELQYSLVPSLWQESNAADGPKTALESTALMIDLLQLRYLWKAIMIKAVYLSLLMPGLPAVAGNSSAPYVRIERLSQRVLLAFWLGTGRCNGKSGDTV